MSWHRVITLRRAVGWARVHGGPPWARRRMRCGGREPGDPSAADEAGGRHSGEWGGQRGFRKRQLALEGDRHTWKVTGTRGHFSADGGSRDWVQGCVRESLGGRRSASQFRGQRRRAPGSGPGRRGQNSGEPTGQRTQKDAALEKFLMTPGGRDRSWPFW